MSYWHYSPTSTKTSLCIRAGQTLCDITHMFSEEVQVWELCLTTSWQELTLPKQWLKQWVKGQMGGANGTCLSNSVATSYLS